MNYSAIVLCAGSGSRANLGYNKVLYEHNQKPIFLHAVESFLNDETCTQVIIVTKANEREQFQKILEQVPNNNKIEYCDGGNERNESVENAMNVVTEAKVLIHDAARLSVDPSDLKALCEALNYHDAVLLGLPVVDTVKRVIGNQVVATEDRTTLFLAQTPQAFHVAMLKNYLFKAKEDGYVVTDEIMLVEQYKKGARIKMLQGSKKYNKWTHEEDFEGVI